MKRRDIAHGSSQWVHGNADKLRNESLEARAYCEHISLHSASTPSSQTAVLRISRTCPRNNSISHTLDRDGHTIMPPSCAEGRAKSKNIAGASRCAVHPDNLGDRKVLYIKNQWAECDDIAHCNPQWVRDNAHKFRRQSREAREHREQIPP